MYGPLKILNYGAYIGQHSDTDLNESLGGIVKDLCVEKESFEQPYGSRTALVISCYQWVWQEVLTIEAAAELRNRGYHVEYLDLSSYSANMPKNFLKWAIGRRSRIRGGNGALKKLRVEVVKPYIPIILSKLGLFCLAFFRYLPKREYKSCWDIAYPGLVDLTGDIGVSINNQKRLVKKTLISVYFFKLILRNSGLRRKNYDRVVIVNGRFPLNRAATLYFRQLEQNVELIEFGANRDKFQIYTASPHSMTNRLELFQKFRSGLNVNREVVDSIGAQFFMDRREFDKQANLSWTRKMHWKEIPDLGDSLVCTFFPTSEREFSGVRDAPKHGEFSNQFDALESLIVNLGSKWNVFIRRHPMAQDSLIDPEVELWKRFEKFKNVTLINPDSEIDSYELGMRSDLVAHFGSFIGPELIFAGHKSVITLGHTQWEDLDPDRHLLSETSLLKYLQRSSFAVPRVDINLLGYYMSTFGEDFKLCSWNQDKLMWTLNQEVFH